MNGALLGFAFCFTLLLPRVDGPARDIKANNNHVGRFWLAVLARMLTTTQLKFCQIMVVVPSPSLLRMLENITSSKIVVHKSNLEANNFDHNTCDLIKKDEIDSKLDGESRTSLKGSQRYK